MSVRVRIAPSPTGYLHVGTARAALFNWLYARHNDGVFIVRVDDTDRERSTPEFEEDILTSLRWLGLDWDEGVAVGGPHGSYRQSDRYERYRQAAEQLVESGAAYYDDRSAEDLEALRKRAHSEGLHPGHYIRRPDPGGDSGAIRLSIPQDAPVSFDDLVRGTVSFEPRDLDDFVILRSDGTPTYHLASTVDDVDYQISHVARGEDLLPSTPKHILLARALGAAEATYAHLPLLFGTDGKKLSKRFSATSLSVYRDEGYLADAVFNYLSLLGWSLDAETTLFSREQAVAAFDLRDVSKNPAVFDPEKLSWMNGEYIRALPPDRFAELTREQVEGAAGRVLAPAEWDRYLTDRPVGPGALEAAHRRRRSGAFPLRRGRIRLGLVGESDDPGGGVGSPGVGHRTPRRPARLGLGRDRASPARDARGTRVGGGQGPATDSGGDHGLIGEPSALRVHRCVGQGGVSRSVASGCGGVGSAFVIGTVRVAM